MAFFLPVLRRAALWLGAIQLAITLVVAAAAGWLAGLESARSALIGGGIGIVAGLYQALRLAGRSLADDPARFMRAVYVGEGMKILLTAVLFVVAIRVMQPRFAPTMVAYAATFIAYWIALGTGYPWAGQIGEAGGRRERTTGERQ